MKTFQLRFFLLLSFLVFLSVILLSISTTSLMSADKEITNTAQCVYENAQGTQYGPVFSNQVSTIVVDISTPTCAETGGSCRIAPCSNFDSCSARAGECSVSGQYCCSGSCAVPPTIYDDDDGGADDGGGAGGEDEPPPTTGAPVISSVTAGTKTTNSIRITWRTNEPTTSRILYGRTYGLELDYVRSSGFTTNHSVLISGLSQHTTYYYKIIDTDRSGQQTQSAVKSFQTLSTGETDADDPGKGGTTPDLSIPSGLSEEELIKLLKAQILAILAQITELQARLMLMLATGGTSSTSQPGLIPTSFKFNSTLSYGDRGAEVSYLQIFLKMQGSIIYPERLVTGYFGALTQRAVIRFQEKYAVEILAPWRLKKGTGVVGGTTRAKINRLLGR